MSDHLFPSAWAQQLPESVVIFGCGYVGTALAEALLAAGVRVGALTRNAATAQQLRDLGVQQVVVADLDSEVWHAQLSASYAAVVNCVSSAGGGIDGYRKSYLDGQRSILKWAAGRAIRAYLYTSSTSVYPQDDGQWVDETADTRGAPETGQVLLASERLLTDAASSFDCWYVFRLAGIYGPDRHYLLDLLHSGAAVIPGSGDYFLNLIHRDDIVRAIGTALANPSPQHSGIYNVADSAPSTKARLAQWLADALGIAPPRFDPKAVSSRLQRRGGRMVSRQISSAKLIESLAWTPRFQDFRDGYRALLADPELK
jgi:nucleoside-diphosphate-sugar epimerase